MGIERLVGQTLCSVRRSAIEDEENVLVFETINGDKYQMFHMQDCCESVRIDDICGDLDDLVGHPILRASEEVEKRDPDDLDDGKLEYTFYHISTIKGTVTITWRGSSNGYYSVGVSFEKTS